MTARWRKLKGELEASSGHDFERRLLPLLRLRWPALVHPKSLGHLDVQGIDQLLLADGQPLPVVVQCKGFEVHQPLDRSQIAQVRASVDKFHASPYRCATYVLAYNRSGIDRTFAAEARRALDGLVQTGKATQALLWDLNTMATELAGEMTLRIVQELQRLAAVAQTAQRSPFLFGDIVIESVPHRCGRLQLRRHDTPQLLMDQAAPPHTDPAQTCRGPI